MSDRDRRPDNVGDLLRAGDPLGGQRLDPGQARRMRAEVVAAGREARDRAQAPGLVPSPWRAPLAVTLVVALALLTWRVAGPPAPSTAGAGPAPPLESAQPAQVDADTVLRRAEATPRAIELAPVATPGVRRSAPLVAEAAAADRSTDATDAPAVAATAVADAAPEASRSPRHLQFTAPGGTRIVWTLDPDFRPVSTDPIRSRDEPRQGDNLK